jgi:hypothetical protein
MLMGRGDADPMIDHPWWHRFLIDIAPVLAVHHRV